MPNSRDTSGNLLVCKIVVKKTNKQTVTCNTASLPVKTDPLVQNLQKHQCEF